MNGANGTAQFWKNYSERNGYYSAPTTEATDPDIDTRLRDTEERLEVAAEWLVDLMARVAVLEAQVAR